MKKIYLLLITAFIFFKAATAQTVVVAGADAATVAGNPYTTLKAAFDNINLSSQAGNVIVITVTGVTTESASAVLNQSAGPWTSLTIVPAGASQITGNIAGHLVDLNGADNVTIDGLNAAGNSLAINNANSGNASSTIRFVNDATNNLINKVNILGSAGNALGSGFGVVYFGGGTTTGNDNNTINQCSISASSNGTPLNGIYSFGTSAVIDNSNNTISVNNISDYFNQGAASNGMNINSNNSGWTITNNALYQTATRTATTAATHNGIFISSGSGYTISNNVIGFAAPNATGTTNYIGLTSGSLGGTFPSSFTVGGAANATRYNAINCAFTTGGAVSSIQNNTIGGIALYTSSGASTTFGVICGIAVTSGNANIGTVTGNTIGAATGTNSIYVASTTAGAVVSGIYCTTTNTISIQNNTIGGITVSGTSATTAAGFKGIEGAGAGNYTISNNSIGNATANNIRTGYFLTGANLSNTATTATTATGTSAIQGILSTATGTTMNITVNTLQGFQLSGSATTFTGINSTGAVSGTIQINGNNLGTSGTNLLAIAFATSGGILCINNSGGTSACSLSMIGNVFQGLSYNNECTGSFRCMNNSATVASWSVLGNNFNNITVNTSGSTIGFLVGATSATPTVSITGNFVTSQFTNLSTTGAVNFIAIGCASGTPTTGSTTITNNTLSNITYRTTTNLGAAIYWVNGTGAACTHSINISNNVISNVVNNGTASTAAQYGITVGNGYINTIANNTISGIYGKAQVIGLLANAASTNAAGSYSVNNNTVFNINSSTGTSQAQGIQCAAGPTQNIFRNKVYDVNCTGAGVVIGLLEASAAAGTTANIYNNLIGRLYAPNSGFFQAVRGITFGSSLANTANVYYNTVYLDGNCGTNSYCVYMNNATPTFNLRNNILINNAVATGGFEQMAIFRVGTLTGTYATTSDNNILYAGTPGPLHLIYGDGAAGAITNAQQTLASFQAFVTPREANSKTELTPFFTTSPGSHNSYLHINWGGGSQAESGAVNIGGFTDDFDGETRQGNGGYTGTGTAPDMGADEMDGSIDKLAPDIYYTALINTTCLTNPTFTATIKDTSNINTLSGTRPRVYFKTSLNANSLGATNDNTTNGWKWVEASNSTSPFSFTIDYSLIFGGVAAGSNIQYFVVAQDLAPTPNVAISSGAFAVAPSSVALTGAAFAITGLINNYDIRTGIPTSVTIGAAGTYTSLTGLSGLFADINDKGLSGNTVVNIIDASVTETGLYALNQMANGCGLANYTLTIKPNAAATTLTGALASQALIRIKSNNVIIDGSSNGTSSRDLTITNTSATSPNVILFGSTGTTAITNCTLKNSVVTNGATTASAVLIGDAFSPGTQGYFNNITIQNNLIQKDYIGVFAVAAPQSGNGSGLNINSNNLNSMGINQSRLMGIYLQGVDGATVQANQIGNYENVNAENDMGIWLASGTINTTVSDNIITTLGYTGTGANAPTGINITSGSANSGNVISGNNITGLSAAGTATVSAISLSFATSGVTINKNYISNIKNTNATGYGANGINLSSTLTSNAATVYNNEVSDVAGAGFAGAAINNNGYGIVVNSGGGYKIYYNSVHMNTDQSNVAGLPAAINITSGVTAPSSIDLRNNIFSNSQTTGTDRYAIYSGAANNVFSNIDYNDYYTAGPNLGYLGGNLANLAALQTGFGGNTNSLNVQPVFTAATDLHLDAANNCRLDGYGIPIAGFTTDYDAQTRDAGGPDMGMDEFSTSPAPSSMATASNCDIKNVSPSGTLYVDGSCNLIARVLPSGGNAVAGKIRTCVTIDGTQQYFNGQPYVQRHYDIEPEVADQTTTSATITLYFTNAEFVAYNTNNPAWPQLPTAVLGNADPNIANVKVTQFHGVGFGSPTAPGNYPGVRVLVTPLTVFYNGSFWEITFNVSGFSGFYVHTNNFNSPLPILVNYLTGRRQGSNHLLNWKVTCAATPRATMTLERSSDSRNFTGINTITADAARCNSPFDYTDASPLPGMNYYRLKITDADGHITYSTTVALLNAVKGFDIISIVPNPVVADKFNLNIASAQAGKTELSIFDMQGRLISTQSITLAAGFNSLPVNVAALPAATYTIRAGMAGEQAKTMRFVKR